MKSNTMADLGNILEPKDVNEIPEITYEADSDGYYTLIFTDPDTPRRRNPVQKEWIAWIVVNIPGAQVKNGDTLTEYVGASPPMFTEVHRYVFLVYKQPSKLTFDEPFRNNSYGGNRVSFSTQKFAIKYGLGDPIAGNFFQAEYDKSVATVLRQLMFPHY